MAKKIKLEMTEAQFTDLINLVDSMSAMSIDENSVREVRSIDRMLKNNGYKRTLK